MPYHAPCLSGLFGACLGLLIAPAALAQGQGDGPILRLGLTTGGQFNTNRTLDRDDPGSTTELSSQLDFLARFATPTQSLDIGGDVTLRGVNGAEADAVATGLVDPNLRLNYTRRSRDAQLDTSAFYSEQDVFASELQFDPVTADFDLLDSGGTQRRFGIDTRLDLRRRAPFGISLSAGFTGVRFSDTTDPDLSDEDRFRAGLGLRFDLTPVTQANVDLRFSSFEDFGDDEGRRDTYALDAGLRRTLTNGDIGLNAIITDTEDGTRSTLRGTRGFETALWQVTGALGLTREVTGDVTGIGGIDLAYALPNGALTAGFDRSVRSGTDDEEEEVTRLDLGYRTQLNALTQFNAQFSFTDRQASDDGDDGRFTTLSLAVQRQLTRDWSLNIGLEHRIVDDDDTGRADDNLFRVNLRRDLLARR
ncbi:MAG: hypothetical protein AAGF33_00045 [Pseudomonadota bacterium]